ncbi:lipopolysaccharide biosynthesis protein [Rhodococcus opacus]|uniref:lipopolysaccharide biosynthesis protein n=1 Tax=Rhodococcus opacus TaxID=37919 RepID=UPI0037CA609E
MNSRSSAITGSVVTLAGQWIKLGLQLGSLIILSRLLSPSEIGQFALVLTVIAGAQMTSDLGLSLAAVQSRTISHFQKSNLAWINASVGAILGLSVYLLSPLLGNFYSSDSIVPVLRVCAISFVCYGVSAQFKAELERNMKFGRLAIIDIIPQLVGFGIAVCWALVAPSVWALAAQQVAVVLCMAVLTIPLSGWIPSLPRRRQHMRALLTFGAYSASGQLVNYISSSTDTIVVGYYESPTTLGIYSRSIQIFSLPINQIAAPLTRVALPILMSVYDNVARYEEYLRRAQVVLSYSFLLIFSLLFACSEPILELLLGTDWIWGAPILQVLSIGGAFQAVGYIYYWIFLSSARMDLQFRFGVATRLVTIVIIVAVGSHGPIWVAAGTAFGLMLNWLVYTTLGIPRAGASSWPLALIACRAFVLVALPATIWLYSSPLLPVTLPAPIQIVCYSFFLLVCIGVACAVSRTIRADIAGMFSIARSLVSHKREFRH